MLALAGMPALAGCSSGPAPGSAAAGPTPAPTSATSSSPSPSPTPSPTPSEAAPPTAGTAAEVLARSTVPVLCFHQIREFRADDSEYARRIITPPAVLTAQLQALRDGGYTPVTGTALVDHLELGTALPDRPVLITFDDGSVTHVTAALPVLQELGFPATFFPMTVVLDKPDWLSSGQVRELDAAGMTIGAHTWDHQRVDELTDGQWEEQLDDPAATLAGILGHPVDLIAYPHGAWNREALPHVADAGYRAAFQLSEDQDPDQPLLSIRRIMPPPTWDGATLLDHLESDF